MTKKKKMFSKIASSIICVLIAINFYPQELNAQSCYATEVVSYTQGLTNQGLPVLANRSNPDVALGAPNAQSPNTPGSTAGGFFSLGFGGEIVLKFAQPILNGPGADLKIWETTWGNPTCSKYPEHAEISASIDGVTWTFLGTVCLDGEVDLGTMPYAQYIKIVDVSDPNDFSKSPISDGYDVDAIECIHGFYVPEPDLTPCYATEVVSFSQGLTNQGMPVLAERSNPNAALGAPDAQAPSTPGATKGKYFSLGFGGEIVLKFDQPIVNGPGADLKIWETSWGDPSCNKYPEHADISASIDGISWTFLGTICLDGEVDLGTMPYAQYIKIVDVSNPNNFNKSPISDGYDVDAIQCLNGYYVPEPDITGCFATEVVSFTQGLNNEGNPVLAERSDPNAALGAPDAQPPGTSITTAGKFFSLGFGGEIVLKFDQPIANGPGADLKIWETTWSDPTCENYPEKAEISASIDGIIWTSLGTVCLNGEVDLSTMPYAQYIKIIDVSDPNDFGSPADGYDLDAIQCLNGYYVPEPDIAGCFATEVVSYTQGLTNQGLPVLAERSNPNATLGAPDAQAPSTPGSTTGEFFSLGFGGEIVLKFAQPIANGPGADLKIWETSWGDPSCSNYPEHAEISASIDGITWTFLGTVCLDGEVDLGTMPYAQYIKIVDVSDPNNFSKSPISDGFDVDAIECLHGFYVPEPDLSGCFATEVVSYTQGLTNEGDPVLTERSNPNAALGAPDAQAPSTPGSTTGEYFSLGFGGEIVLKFAQPIANGPGADLKIWETTWEDPLCKNYPEYAEISASIDGITWTFLGTVCLDGEVDLGTMPYAQYIKIVDVSDPNDFDKSPISDGFDVDAIECLHGFYVPEPDPIPCYATEVVSYSQGLTNQNNPVLTKRSNPDAALGAPDAQDPFNYNEANFFSLGFGGEIVLKFDQPIANGPGADLKIWETTGPVKGSAPTCTTYPEFADVYASNDNANWTYLGQVCLDGEVDLGSMPYATYIKIVDVSDPNAFNKSPVSDGFDVDAVQCLNGYFVPPTGDLQCFAHHVVSSNQGMDGAGNSVDANRSNPLSVLGASDAQSNSTSDLNKFFSLGFGGEIVVEFDGFVVNGPGADLKIWETTWNYGCGIYPELAEVSASLDGINWFVLDTICQTGEVELGNLQYAKYIKIRDVSVLSDFSFSPKELDGYDVDAIQCLNGLVSTIPTARLGAPEYQEIDEVDGFAIAYPNPFRDVLTIQYSASKAGTSKISVYDINGRVVFNQYVQHTDNVLEHNFDIDLSRETNGLYIVRVSTDDEVYTFKVNKMK